MSTDVVPISASPTLATLCTAGVLSAADIHLATMVCRLCHESEESVRLALALTSRELRQGSVFLSIPGRYARPSSPSWTIRPCAD